ncbi:MAG: hypothetical protein ABIP75_19975 [Pyrinomonadaceae bacterium]
MTSNEIFIDPQTLRRCPCPDVPEMRWESPKRRMYSCPECGMWWEVPKQVPEEETMTEPPQEAEAIGSQYDQH